MCGISAVFSTRGNAGERVPWMNSAQRHRGPDASGTWVSPDGRVGLGHRRLSILDLSAHANQPMTGPGGTVIVFNGEIYNFRELRGELEQRGRRFATTSDTEVILAAYAEWGEGCVSRFNGMWAFALYDPARRRLLFSRDRLGMKPLYVASTPDGLLAASEVKAILAAGHAAAVDCDGLNEYFTFQNILSYRTLFAGVSMLPPGTNLFVDLDTGRQRREAYWQLRFAPVAADEDELAEEFLAVFRRAMKRHLVSDVEVGATLSGGMDSSAIVALATEQLRGMHTFTGFFETASVDADDRCVSEQADARLIASRFGTHHHERQIAPQDVMDTLPAIVWHLEDPKVGMCYTFHTISQLVSSWVTVNLSGTGGDEIFAGYPWRYAPVQGLTDPAAFDEAYYSWWSRLIKDTDKPRFFTDRVQRTTSTTHPRAAFQAVMAGAGDAEPLNRALYFDSMTFLHGFLLVEDRLGMAFGIETRFPFLDTELVEFGTRIPTEQKLRNGVAKYLLKQAFKPLLPEETLHKRKQGFTPPDKTWFRRELKDYIQQLLLSRRSCIGEFIEPAAIRAILDRHNQGADERLTIWSLMFFEGWCRVFLKGERQPGPTLF
ncbi:asparagine synthase (glutamine-hydrolyzing) [Horticoccus sp. 23ND18S-11]|uniref:asparagine synthase (glutamine-hydrolyzing) n=1 Tax=Horticoccus sp. 23ND18S-11 TaxID=3391832 RepID=UPI0039C908E6